MEKQREMRLRKTAFEFRFRSEGGPGWAGLLLAVLGIVATIAGVFVTVAYG